MQPFNRKNESNWYKVTEEMKYCFEKLYNPFYAFKVKENTLFVLDVKHSS